MQTNLVSESLFPKGQFACPSGQVASGKERTITTQAAVAGVTWILQKTATILVAALLMTGIASGSENLSGENIAKTHCSRCHIVDESNRFSGISSSPSFKILITALDDWEQRFETFFDRNPHQSVVSVEGLETPGVEASGFRGVNLTRKEFEALMSHIRKLAESYSRQ